MLLCWRNLFEILKGRVGPGIAGPAAGGAQVDPGQQRGEIGGGHLDTAGGGGRDPEGAALEPLGPDRVPVAIPVEDLEPVAAAVGEDEEVPG